jgi:ketosteroid isomerase-like protein
MPCPYHTALVALVLVAACVSRTVTPRGAEAATTPDAIETIARLAIGLDAKSDPNADSLYAPDAVVVANARVRVAAPRLAGVGAGGQVAALGATVTLEGRFAWVLMDYRWTNVQQRLAEAGRATLVFERRERGWKIVHLHSSQLLPWDR